MTIFFSARNRKESIVTRLFGHSNIKHNTLLRENLEMLKCHSTRVESVIFLLSVLWFGIFLYGD